MTLQHEIDQHRREIHTDSYQMSIGELMNLYRDSELEIHPEYQRFFRWEATQKSRWIESILLGIPLPSVFVSQREDGVWELVDGLQRISTILEFAGELLDEDGELIAPLELEKTKLLPSLEGATWETLSEEQRRYIKRSKISVNIILRESREGSQYELFQRLNTGGTFLSDQELRSALLISINRDFYQELLRLAHLPDFQSCLAISDKQKDEQYDLEIVVRFMVLRSIDPERVATFRELSEFLTDEIIIKATDEIDSLAENAQAFETVFALLNQSLGSDSFRKYDIERQKFTGGFLVSAFEVIAIGLGFNVEGVAQLRPEDVVEKVQNEVWAEPDFLTSSGQRATQRLPRTLERGREVFAQ